jgi:hypothetical protein
MLIGHKIFREAEGSDLMIRTWRFKWLVIHLFLLFGVTACSDYAAPLPNGYSLVSVYAGAVVISGPGEEHIGVIGANIERYKVLGELVVGHVNMPEYLSPEEKEVSKPGYFILDTRTHEVKAGLDKKAWLDSLKVLGISSEPRLSKPSSWDRILNRIY